MRLSITTGRRQVGVSHFSLLRYGFAGCLLVSNILHAQQAQPFTLQQILSAPYASNLTAAPTGNLFAWVEDAEGHHNLWIGGKDSPACQITHNAADDGLDITNLTWSPDAKAIAFTYGTPNGADGKPANPAHLQHSTARQIILQPIAADAQPVVIGEGHAPLFEPLNHHLFFIRSGQIWSADLDVRCVSDGGQSGCTIEVPATSIRQLIFDRGTASQLTLSPDGNTLAFISHRHQPDHADLALFNLKTNTLTFPALSTGNDSAPAFSHDGQHLAWIRAPYTQAPDYTPRRTSPNPWSIQLLDLTRPITAPGFEGAGLQPRRGAAPQEVRALAPEGNPRTIYAPEPNKPGTVLPHLSAGEPYLLWTADNRILFYSEADGWNHLYAVSLSGMTSGSFTRGPEEIENLSLDANGGRLLFSSNYDGIDTLDSDRRHIISDLLPDGSTETLGMERETSGTSIETHPLASAEGTIAMLASDVQTPMHPAILASKEALRRSLIFCM